MLVPLVITTSNALLLHWFAIEEATSEEPAILINPLQPEKA